MEQRQVGINLPESPYYCERIYPTYRDRFSMIWTLTRSCNFACPYDGPPPCDPYPIIDPDAIVERMQKVLPPKGRIIITGGEPLMVNRMIELCQKIGAIGWIIEMQTNFSVRTKEFIDATDPSYIERLSISVHAEERELKIKDGMKKLVEDMVYAKNKGFNVMPWYIDYPLIPTEQFMANCKMIYDAGIVPMRKRYLGVLNNIFYQGDTIWVQGKKCFAGYKGCAMWEDYSITVCEADRRLLGNLFGEVKFDDTYVVCRPQHCGCLGKELIADEYYDEFYKRYYGANHDK